VGVPMAVGYLRPLILLPGCVLTGLTTAQLEALLAHELAHIRRHDWLVNALQLFVETVFFYHPAVWWLSRQIRQERENCCDDLAVSLVGDRGTVGRMLLALEELRERTPGLALAATGGNLVSRVRRVVAKGRQPEPAGREWLPAAVFLLLAGLGGAAWALSAGADQRKNPPSATPAVTAKNDARRAAQTPDVRRIAGRVVDGKGQPVQAAHLWWVVRDNYPYERPFTIEGTSDAEGRFALEAPAVRKARRPGRTPADVLWVLAAGKDLKAIRSTKRTAAGIVRADLEISLEPATDSDYRVVDEQGRPVARAVVEPSHDLTPRGYEYLPEGVLGLLRRTTDSAGRVRLTSLPREDLYVQIQAAGFGCQRQQFDGPDESSPERKITLRRAGRVKGRLIADDPRWVRSIHLLYSTQPPPGGPTVPVTLSDGTKEERVIYKTEGEALVETDAQGHFQIPEIAAGASRIEVIDLPASSPVAPRMPSGLFVEAGETAHVDIPMEKLVRVKGTVRTDDPQSPVAGAEISVHYGKWFQEDVVTSDNRGHYEARVLPGSVYMRVRSKHPEIGAGYEENPMLWPKKVSVPAGGAEFELPPIVLVSTETRTGTLIDQDGRPIASARVWGMRGDRPCGAAETNGSGDFSLRLPKKLGMDSYEVLQLHGRKRSRVKATILKYEPLTLQTDLAASAEKRAKPKPQPDDKRQKKDERKPAASAGPSAPFGASAEGPSIALAATESKSSAGGPVVTGKAGPGAKTPEVRRISGRVVDSQGQPVKAARLWWVVLDNYLNDRQYTIEGTSDAQGRFALEAPAAWKPRLWSRVPADVLWVLAPGKDLKVVRATDGLTVDGKEPGLVIPLAPATETEYEIRDEQGHPVAGALVEPWHFRTPRSYEYVPTGLRELVRRTSDQSGRSRLTSLPRENFYTLQIQAVGFGTQQQRLDGPDESSPRRRFTLRATGRIEGRLIADDGQWVRGVKLLFRTEQWPRKTVPITPPDGTNRRRIIWETEGESLVETDEQGRFRIPAIGAGVGSIMVVGARALDLNTKSPVAPRLPARLLLKAGETVHLDMPMEKLVFVKGTIRTDDTQAPIAGADISVRYGKWWQEDMVTSDSQGAYEARVLPGPVYTQVLSMPQEILAHYEQIGDPSSNPVEVFAGRKEFELPPIVLAATQTRIGTLIDERGRPIPGARVSGIRGNRVYGFAETNGRGEFSLQLPKKLAMDSYQVGIRGRQRDRRKPTIVKYEPFTLQFDVTANGEKPAKSKDEPAPKGTSRSPK
ncbi:MAG TPA: M56 family metallopeptidase, partial [Planctomycetaceae bacterium]|nr:M56 family metallopeptidase [Planctomycetaceae bacterium]